MNIKALSEALRRLRNEVCDLKEEERESAEVPKRIPEQTDRHRTRSYEQVQALSAVSRVPSEILSAIFICASDGESNVEGSVVLVSRRWNAVAMDTPALWRHVKISPERGMDRLVLYLARSRNCMLDTTISCYTALDRDSLRPSLAALSQQFGRVRTLTCLGDTDDELKLLMAILPDAAPSLTVLNLRVENIAFTLDQPVALFPAGAPQLRRLALDGLSFSTFALPMSRITSVSISHPFFLDPPATGFQEMPSLTRLDFHTGSIEMQQTPFGNAIIKAQEGNVYRMMDMVVACALAQRPETLTMASLGTAEMQVAFHEFAVSSIPQPQVLDCVRTLELRDCKTAGLLYRPSPLMDALPSLTTLIVTDSEPRGEQAARLDDFLRNFARLDAIVVPAVLPGLRRLEVRNDPTYGQPVHVSLLRDLVRARAAAGVPLGTLALLASNCSQMEPAALVELQEEVSVEVID